MSYVRPIESGEVVYTSDPIDSTNANDNNVEVADGSYLETWKGTLTIEGVVSIEGSNPRAALSWMIVSDGLGNYSVDVTQATLPDIEGALPFTFAAATSNLNIAMVFTGTGPGTDNYAYRYRVKVTEAP